MAREEMARRATSNPGCLLGRVALSLLLVFVTPAGMTAVAGDVDHGDIHVHDPLMVKQGRTYYVFSTGGGIQIRTSTDLVRWRFAGTVFATIPSWVTDAVGPISDLWAPDVSYFNGLYHLYYAGSQFGMNTSVIGLATNTTLDPSSPRYHWHDRGLVIQSTASDDFNAIDPSVVFDTTHVPWLVFGSFWSGIKLRRLDARMGKPSTADTTLYSLATRAAPDAIEAPYIVHRGRYYYLFVSFDFCCRGAQSTYRIMVGRARRVTGPYVDDHGWRMMDGAARQVLAGYGRYRGPGGQSIFVQGKTYWLVYHYYDAVAGGISKLQIRSLRWTSTGWPEPGPPIIS